MLLQDRNLAKGLGLRRDFIHQVMESPPDTVDFWELAPENWMKLGGRFSKQLRQVTEKKPVFLHGLSLSLGGIQPLDINFLRDLKLFIREHGALCYSEHLSYSSDQGHLYDLLPIPFTSESVDYVVSRIKKVQDILEQKIAIENISYYAAPGKEIPEIDFINAILETADCDLLLDVNNVYVNSINHGYNAIDYLKKLPGHRIRYLHVAGHYMERDDFLIDTHGADVIDPVWKLLHDSYCLFGVMPTLLERDFNIPELASLINEVERIGSIQTSCSIVKGVV